MPETQDDVPRGAGSSAVGKSGAPGGGLAAAATPTATPIAEPTGTARRRWTVALLGVLAVVVLAYVAGALLLGNRIPRDTTVSGVAIGGMSRTGAESTLSSELAPQADEPVTVTAGDVSRNVVPSEAGVTLDAAATVAAAGPGNRWNPGHLLTVLTGGGPVDPVADVDSDAVQAVVSDIATEADTEPTDGAISFDSGVVTVVDAVDGVSVDQDAAAERLGAGLLTESKIALPVTTTAPTVDAADVQQAVTDFATPAMSGPVTVAAGDTRVELTPAEVGPHLTMTADADGVLKPAVDAAGLVAALPDKFAALVKPPQDATFTFVDDKPSIVPGVDGTAIDAATLQTGLLAALPASGDARVAEATVATQPPAVTTESLQALGVVEKISEFTTNYPIAPYRVTNIGRAAELINGTLLRPDDTFSLNDVVGERTEANGFVVGTVISDGQFAEELGGGVSQVATTTFNAMFFAGLEDVEHKPHSFYISRYPAGREATVAWPTVDLQFKNDSGHGVLIQTIHTPGTLTVRFWGTKVWDEIQSVSSDRSNIQDYQTRTESGPECVDQPGVDGFDITVTRNFVRGGAIVRSEDFNTHYNPADDITCT